MASGEKIPVDKAGLVRTPSEELEESFGKISLPDAVRRRFESPLKIGDPLAEFQLSAAMSRRVARRRRGWTVVVGPEIR